MRVQPVRNRETVARITEILRVDDSKQGRRRYLLWMTGIYTGRRVSDILRLKVGDVLGKSVVMIKEKKTGKFAEIYIPRGSKLFKAYLERLADMDPDDYIFKSPTPDPETGEQRPIDRQTAYRDMQAIKAMMGITDNVGTHTMRKTFGYWYYQSTHDIGGLMIIYNHSSERVTKIYIGIGTDETREAYGKVAEMY